MSIRWANWRREVLFLLAGVVVASAAYIPLFWVLLHSERERAETAENEAAKQRAIAEEQIQFARQEVDRIKTERERVENNLNEQYKLIEKAIESEEVIGGRAVGPRRRALDDELEPDRPNRWGTD